MQAAEAAELARGEELLLPPDLDYSALQLSAEDREKLGAARCAERAMAAPDILGQPGSTVQ